MENTTKKTHKKPLFYKIKRFIRKALRRTAKFATNIFNVADDTIIETLYPDAIKNKALKKEYLKLLSLKSANSLTSLDTFTANMGSSTINSGTLSPIEAEIIKRIEVIRAKEKAKELRKAYRKRIVVEKLKRRTTVNSDTKATERIVYAAKSNPLPSLSYSEVTAPGKKPVFNVQTSKNLTIQGYHQNIRE